MTNYIKAELFRIRNKKNIFKYFVIMFIMYILTVVVRSRSIEVVSEGQNIIGLFSLFIGGVIFSTVYNDDLSNKTIPQAIGFGNHRRNIVLSKAIVVTITTSIIYLLGFIVFNTVFFAIGKNSFSDVSKLLNTLGYQLVVTIGFSFLSSIVVFYTQKSTFSIVSYVMLASGVVKQLVFLIATREFIKNLFGDIIRFTLSGATSNIFTTTPKFSYLGVILIYAVLSLAISTILFNKKELEF